MQVLQLNGSAEALSLLEGGFTLGFDGETTEVLTPEVNATAMREALMNLSTVGEIEVFRDVRRSDLNR